MSVVAFLSPHLDDAVFSCAGMIQRCVAAKSRVLITTVFSSSSSHPEERQAEDQSAAHRLGVEVKHLGHLDAPDRTPGYHSFRDLIFGWHPEDEFTVNAVVESLQHWFSQEPITHLFAPLGVGTHVDHRLVHRAVKRAALPCAVTFYEDRPYSYAQGATELRLRELGIVNGDIEIAELLKAFRQLPHVRQYLPPGLERKNCERLLLRPLSNEATQPAISELLHGSKDEASRAHQAAACYVSQFAAFCSSPRRLRQLDIAYSQRLGSDSARAERYWHLPHSAPSASAGLRGTSEAALSSEKAAFPKPSSKDDL